MTAARILPNTPTLGRFAVELDGVEVTQALTSATLDLRGGEFPVLTLELVAVEVGSIDMDNARVFLGGATVELLGRAGWTPPPGVVTEAVHGGVYYRPSVPLTVPVTEDGGE